MSSNMAATQLQAEFSNSLLPSLVEASGRKGKRLHPVTSLLVPGSQTEDFTVLSLSVCVKMIAA